MCTNSQAEYDAVIIGLEMLLDLGAQDVDILGDSLLVATVSLENIPHERNFGDNELAQIATGVSLADGVCERILKVEKRTLPLFMTRKENNDKWLVATVDALDVHWRQPIMDYLINPSTITDKRIRFLALNYVFKGGELLRRGEDDVDFLCVYGTKAKRILREVHLLKCQVHGLVQHIPNIPMQPIIKPWSGRGWAFDFVGVIHPYSSQQHKFILVGTDFFTKWVEVKPVKEASAKTVCQFIFRNFICRYGIPECLMVDRGAAFMAIETQEFLNDYGIKFLHFTPYYAQFNGQAETSNKIILSILKRMLADNPHDWHNELDNTL
ncbi:hypothetical protein ACLB2K_038024 [Fragaria x ananassa]